MRYCNPTIKKSHHGKKTEFLKCSLWNNKIYKLGWNLCKNRFTSCLQSHKKIPFSKWVCCLSRSTCSTVWRLSSFSLNSPLNVVHFQSPNICLLPFNRFAICLHRLYLTSQGRAWKWLSASLFNCLLHTGRSRDCLLIANYLSVFFFSQLTPLSWPSQGRSHALLRPINLRGWS